MKCTKINKLVTAIAVMATGAFLLANNASAIIDLGQTSGSPSGVANEVVRLNGQIDLYNAANDPNLPAAVLAGAVDVQAASDEIVSIDIDITGWDYIKLKWDGLDQFYYVGDETGTLTFDSTSFNQNGDPQALSHYALFNPGDGVPDGGSTIALLGFALLGVDFLRRKISRN